MLMSTAERLRKYFQRRAIAYNKVFDRQSPFTEEVLMDLAKFCRAHDSTFHKDDRISAVLEGRREVWLRIVEQLNLSVEDIYKLHRVVDKQGEQE